MMADGLSFFSHPFQSYKSIYDSKLIAAFIDERAAYVAAGSVVRDSMKGLKTSDEVLEAAARVIPDIRTHVEAGETATDTATAVTKYMNSEAIAKALSRQRSGYEAAQRYELPEGVAGDIFDPHWEDVGRTGMEQEFTQTVASSSTRHNYSVGEYKAPELLEEYTAGIASVWAADVRSYEIKLWLEQYARIAAGDTDTTYAASRFVGSREFENLKEPIRNMARHAGQEADNMSDKELAVWYFKTKVDAYARDSFGDVLNAENARLLQSGKATVDLPDGKRILVDLDEPDTVRDLVQGANGTPFKLPESVVGLVNPRTVFGYGDAAQGWKTPLKSYNQWALNKFGHKIPEVYQRRPAYITAFRRYKQNYERLGLPTEAADFAARQKAMEHINKTFFFVEAQTPFLKTMNKVIPFFAAQWEIIKAWTWNIPAAGNYGGVGHAQMLRSFDHIFTAFRDNGLIQPHYDREGNVDSWNLMFEDSPLTPYPQGEVVSRGGYLALSAPIIMLEQLAEIFMETDLDLTPESFKFKFNHPYEFFGKGGGVLPTARMQMGLNPLMALPVGWVNNAMPWNNQSEGRTTKKDQNLAEYVLENEVSDLNRFYAANRHALISSGAVSEDDFALLQDGDMGLANITIPEGVELMLPSTSLMGRMVDTVLFPYGQTSSLQEVASDYTPQVLKNLAKSAGLYANMGDIDGLTAWLPNVIMGPTGASDMGTAYLDAIVLLEMRTGSLGRLGEISEKLAAMDGELLLEQRNHEEGSDKWNSIQDELDEIHSGKTWLQLQSEMHSIDDMIAREVKEQAASRALMQTMMGVLIPFNPKMPSEAQNLREYYYNARTVAEQWKEGNPMVMPFSDRNVMDTWRMVEAWASDDTGSMAKQEFLRQGGGRSAILAAITPRNYWGGSGLPVIAADMNDYFRMRESGEIAALPRDVFQYKYRSMVIQVERDMAIVDRYGNDPMEQARLMLEDGYGHTMLVEEFDERWRALEMEDELVNDGAWAKYSTEVADNYIDFVYNEHQTIQEGVQIAIDELELDLFPDDPQAAGKMVGKLKGIQSSLYAAVETYTDERYADWDISPRQAILNEYYTALGDYYGALSEQYSKVGEADTEAQRRAAYDSVARWRRNANMPIVINGVQFPTPEDKSWNAKSPEKQKAIADAKAG
ncbi:MAG: hypothetical protein ACYS7Y_32890, partial [Planctomycetota bacterium]